MDLKLNIYPPTKDPNKKVSSAADDLMLSQAEELSIPIAKPIVLHDRFGYIACHLGNNAPIAIATYASQRKAITMNLQANGLLSQVEIISLEQPVSAAVGFVRVPKSLDQWAYYLQYLTQSLTPDGIAIAGFMTKYFTPAIVDIAKQYFSEVTQSLAWKKARVLMLSGPKQMPNLPANHFMFRDRQYHHLPGVFSNGKIDVGSAFLIDHLTPPPDCQHMLDLAAGNGIIGSFMHSAAPNAQLTLIDDYYLAIASSKANITSPSANHLWNDNLDQLSDNSLDWIASNPPFHFEFEQNTEVSFELMRQAAQKLKSGRILQIVVNRHLPYQRVLRTHFKEVEIQAENTKFRIWKCIK